MPFKFTMFFNFGGSGFSETWYNNASGTIQNLDVTPYNALAAARDALCAAQVNLVGYRIVDMSNPRLTYTRNYPPVVSATIAPDVLSNAQLAIAHGSNGQGRRQWWMRGMVDDWTEYDVATSSWKVIPEFQTRYQAFTNIVTRPANQWSINAVKSYKDSAVKTGISTLTVGTAGSQAILGVPDGSVFTNSPIIVSGFRRPLSRLNGTYLPGSGFRTGATSISLTTKQITAAQQAGYTGSASVRVQEKQLVQITQFQLDSPRSRRCGRAFFVPRGRRSAR